MRIGSRRHLFALGAACCILAGGCKAQSPKSEGEGLPSAARDTPAPKPPLIVWTGADPVGSLARVLEKLIDVHNNANKERPAILRYLPADAFASRALDADRAEAPPDLLIVPSSLAREMARRGALRPMGDLLASAGIHRSDYYAAAWQSTETGEEGGRVWGLPLWAETRLRFVNLDLEERKRAVSATATPAMPTSGPLAPALWGDFLAGAAPQCVESSNRLKELVDRKDSFRWKAAPASDARSTGALAGETFVLAMRAGSDKPADAALALVKWCRDPGFAGLLWTEASRLPALDPRQMPPRRKAAFDNLLPFLSGWP